MQKNDITIVGGGFAGLACARSAAARGMDTVVLERKVCPGEKIRTTGILVQEAAELLGLPAHLGRRIRGVRLYSPNGNFIDLASPGYGFVATDTPGMMRWLAQQAVSAGADIRLSCNVSRMHRQREGVVMPDLGMTTRYVVGCDGARSQVARQFGLSENRAFLMGLETEYEGIADLDPEFLHVFLDREHAPGYIGWVVPGVNTQQVGLAVRRPRHPDLGAFEKRLSTIFDFSRAEVLGRRAGLIPCGGVVRHWHGERVMLLGDAAGMVSPLTAGGIYPSLHVGARAGEAIARYLQGTMDDPASEIAGMVPCYRWKGLLRWTMDHLQPPNVVCDLALRNPIFRRIAQVLFFHHRGLLCTKAWKEIIGLQTATVV